MDKWEYLSFYSTNQSASIDSNISVENFSTAFPSLKVAQSLKGRIDFNWMGRPSENQFISNCILEYLGAQGWEAYLHNDKAYYFKRKI